jgi:hypothetical protein
MKVAKIVTRGRESLEEQQAVKQMFHELMTARIGRAVSEMREAQRKTVTADNLNCYLDGFAASKEAQQDGMVETFGDGMKAIASGIGNAAAGALADGTGVNLQRLGKLIKTFRRKKPAQKVTVSKVPKKKLKAKRKPKAVLATEPVTMDRKAVAQHLKASGNQLHKIKV